LLYNVGRLLIFKGEKALIRGNPIETLQMLLMDAKDTLKKVKEKITSVDAVQIEMVTNSEDSKKEAEEKYKQVKSLTEAARELDEKTKELDAQGNKEKARKTEREAKETRLSANLRMHEGKASEDNARLYAQYANQFSKVIEILKDNESAARIYVSALDSSITIITKKMEATNKMKNATEGLAEVFNVKDSWKFQEAMNAATSAISSNIANIRMNLEFLEENKGAVSGMQPSQADLESFVKEIDGGRLQTLNISEISDASYDLKPTEKVDKGFNLLD
jgi:chromosome segregation ATPase